MGTSSLLSVSVEHSEVGPLFATLYLSNVPWTECLHSSLQQPISEQIYAPFLAWCPFSFTLLAPGLHT